MLLDLLLAGDLAYGFLLIGYRGKAAGGGTLLRVSAGSLHAQLAYVAAQRAHDIVAQRVELVVQVDHHGVLGTRRGCYLLVLEHGLVVGRDLVHEACVVEAGVAWYELFASHVLDVGKHVVGDAHLQVGVVGVVHILDGAARVAVDGGIGRAHLELCDAAVDAAQVLGERGDAVGDEALGAACHAVLVVECVLVVERDEGVEYVGAQGGVVGLDGEVHDVGSLVGILGGEAGLKTGGHSVDWSHLGHDGKAHVLLVVGVGLDDGYRPHCGVHLVAEAATVPRAVVDFVLQVVAALGHDGHVKRGHLVAERGDLERARLVAVHVAQVHMPVVLDVEPQLFHHLLHERGGFDLVNLVGNRVLAAREVEIGKHLLLAALWLVGVVDDYD